MTMPRDPAEASTGNEFSRSQASAPCWPASSDARPSNGRTVLVVDDEPTVRLLVTEALSDLGYAAVEAADAQEGLTVLRSDAPIHLLVTDVGLPGGMNGHQLADAARALRPDLAVLFITGYAEIAADCTDAGAPNMLLLTKPFTLDALASKVIELTA